MGLDILYKTIIDKFKKLDEEYGQTDAFNDISRNALTCIQGSIYLHKTEGDKIHLNNLIKGIVILENYWNLIKINQSYRERHFNHGFVDVVALERKTVLVDVKEGHLTQSEYLKEVYDVILKKGAEIIE